MFTDINKDLCIIFKYAGVVKLADTSDFGSVTVVELLLRESACHCQIEICEGIYETIRS